MTNQNVLGFCRLGSANGSEAIPQNDDSQEGQMPRESEKDGAEREADCQDGQQESGKETSA